MPSERLRVFSPLAIPSPDDGLLAVLLLLLRAVEEAEELSGAPDDLAPNGGAWPVGAVEAPPAALQGPARPRWDGQALQLWWLGSCIREYRHDAANQRQVLEAFEAHGWPKRLDDPMPREPGINVKKRLRETIKALNRGQRLRRLWFRGDGTGLGVRWEPIG